MSEKTEQPTSKRLRDSRQKGDVAYSKDFTQTFLILAIFGYLLVSAGHIVETLGQMILLPGTLLRLGFNEAANTLIQELLKQAAWIVLPFIGIVLGAGIFADALQVGVLFAFEKLKPSAKKLNVLSNLKNIFSKKNLVEFLKSAIKIAFLSTLLTLLIRDALPIMTSIPQAGLAGLGQVVAALEEARARMPGAEIRLPEYVDDAIADIALIFHWPLDTLTALPLPDLITWRERARVRACPDE